MSAPPAAGPIARQVAARDLRVGWTAKLDGRIWMPVSAILSGDALMPPPMKGRIRVWADLGNRAECAFFAPAEKVMACAPVSAPCDGIAAPAQEAVSAREAAGEDPDDSSTIAADDARR